MGQNGGLYKGGDVDVTYIPMQEVLQDTNNFLLIMTKQLKAILRCLSSMSGLNIKEEDIS